MALIGEMQYLTIGDSTYSIAAGGSDVVVTPILSSGTQVATISVDGSSSTLYAPTPNDMVVLSYGNSTWNDFINAYNTNRVVYCRASSNSNPATGSQTRLAFMAYVNNGDSPTEVEFQYYRSVSSHSASQQGDQVYVYKLTSSGTWTVTTREASSKIAVTSPISSSYSSGTITLSLADAYGDTKNPYGTKTANYVLAGPSSGSASTPSFRALVSSDIPDLSSTYAPVATTLAGYGITDAKIESGTITLGSSTITPLTSFTETDPVFTASAAHGISSSDITNWNGKQSPATTLAGYGITDAFISNGTITLGSNSITPLTSFTETDPTVPSWAKQSTKPTYTASEVGAIASSLKGASNGVAELDANGLVPSSQLPSYVDDVLEYATKSSFPATGETGKIYVDISTNLTYRWSGSAYVEISPSLALGTTSSTAFRGDYGSTAYSHATDSSRLTTATASGLYKIASTAEGHIASLTAVTASDIPDLSGIYSTTDQKLAVSSAVTDITYYPILTTNTASAETKKYDENFKFIEDNTSAGLYLGSNGYLNGQIWLFTNVSGNYLKLTPGTLTGIRTISFPDNSGTLALASDIPIDYIASDEIGKVYVSDTEPSNTSNYDIWIDTSSNLINANGVMV